ncbi:MAG: oxygen-independent coproporphyrinogen III oxidase [Planctomycetota bacterium]|nr:MAG: oxygen-independent coproporphyrinogen III oxidase [Planctomycetota bacterium]
MRTVSLKPIEVEDIEPWIRRSGIDLDMFRRYAGLSLPRHVSYPMPTWWHDISEDEADRMHADSAGGKPGYDLSLYLHIPFCETLCKFCACNRVILRREGEQTDRAVERYLSALETEIRCLAQRTGTDRPLRQVHWGGGSPTYLRVEEIERIQRLVRETFRLAEDAEVAMEIDPRHVDFAKLEALRTMGFTRVSMGVQDFDADVQRHVRRIQPFEQVREVTEACRTLGFSSVNFDLIYGMPYQTPRTILDTVDKTIALAPDRIAYYHYAQIPEKIATQRGMDYTRLPDSVEKLAMFLIGLERFQEAGYVFVGLDHFAKPEEPLAVGLKDGNTYRNFQGMTTGRGLRLVGAGVSAISQLPEVGFLQNVKDVNEYVRRIEAGRLAIERGKRLTPDDRIRQTLINHLYCYGEIRREPLESAFGIEFETYFARELDVCRKLEDDGLVVFDHTTIRATMPLGRVLLRNIAAVFDAYLDPEAYIKGERACFSANA